MVRKKGNPRFKAVRVRKKGGGTMKVYKLKVKKTRRKKKR